MVLTSFETPFFFAGRGIQSVKIGVPTSDKYRSIEEGWRRMHDVARLEFPFQRPTRGVQRVHVCIARSEIYDSTCNGWRREKEVERVGHRFPGWLHAVKMFRRESPLSSRDEFPSQCAVGCVYRVEVCIVAQEEHDAVCDRRSGRDAAVRFEFPFFGARGEIECMDMVIVAAKIHRVCRNDRGRENLSSAMKLPFDLVKCR